MKKLLLIIAVPMFLGFPYNGEVYGGWFYQFALWIYHGL